MAENNTPTNVVDVGNVHDNPNYKVTLNVDNNGNVIIYRSTNTPDRFSDTDFSKFEINKTIGEQTYFASNPEFAQSFSQSGKRNIYSFSTNIKPEEILHLQSNINENKELLNKLGGQEYINNIINERGINNYRFDSLDNIPKNLTWAELYYSTNKGRTNGSKEILQREIVKLQNSGVKAIGVSPVSGAKNEYNILPIINEQSQLDIVAKGLIDKNLKETPIDTPTNVVDDVVKNKGTINEWFNEAIKEYDLVSGTPTGRKDLLRYSNFEEFLINKKGLKKETAEKIIKDIKTGVVTQIELGPKSTTGISPDFAKATGLTDVGISQNVFKDFGVQNYLDTVYTQASDLSSAMYDMSFADRQALQNTFYDSLKNSDGVIEIYLRQVSSVNVPAENVFFKSQLTQEVPGFYTEPIGGLTPGEMASGGGIKPTENFYKLQINKNNLLIDVPGVNFSNELKTKLDWNLLEKELGINYSQFKDIDSYQLFHTKLSNVANDLGIDNTKLYSTLRKSGYEGTVGYVNRQVEVVLLDPNDDLKIGKKVNFENSNVDDFYNNQSKVNQLDELVIKPTNVVDDVAPASVVDEAVEYIDNLNIDSAIKKEVKDKVIKVTGQASGAIPLPGIGQAIDLWETAVLVVGAAALAAGEIDELPKVIYNYGLDLYESILSGYNIPYQPAKRKEYTPNFERISSGLTWIDKLQFTSYVINPVIEEFQETAATTPTMEIPGFGTVPASEYYQPPVQSSPERDNINSIMTNIMTNISNAQGAYPRTARELELFGRNPIQVVPSNSDDKPEKVEYDSKEKQNLHDIYANLYTKLSNASARIE